MPYTIVDNEYVQINGVPLSTTAWEVNDLAPLWDAASLRGEDRVIPFSDGALPLRRFRDEMRIVIPITIWGFYDWNNNANADARIGLQRNIDHLRDNILTPNTAGTGTWNLILVMPDGGTRGAGCFVIPPMQLTPLGPSAVTGVLDILIPQGYLTILTS